VNDILVILTNFVCLNIDEERDMSMILNKKLRNAFVSRIVITVCLLLCLQSAVSQSVIDIDTTASLCVFEPHFSRVELEVGTMPAKDDTSVIFCAAAAFTRDYLDAFGHGNIVGAYVTHGVAYNGYEGKGRYGRFVYHTKRWRFIDAGDHTSYDATVAGGGCAFTQMWVIRNRHIFKPYAMSSDSTRSNVYRALCEKDGKLLIAQSRRSVPYHVFVKALMSYGFDNALYMDMGSGWNHSFYRSGQDMQTHLHILFPIRNNTRYCTNWLTFYK